MKLVILAAGTGSRLLPLTKNKPKSLLDVGDGTCLLQRQLKTAAESGLFNEILIVTGYLTEQIETAIKKWGISLPVKCIFNPVFKSTNNLVSLWCAMPHVAHSDFVITNGDNLYDNQVFPKIKTLDDMRDGIVITTSEKDHYDDDDMKVILNELSHVVRVHKDISPEQANLESVGLAVIKGQNSREKFADGVVQLLKDPAYLEKFWLESFNYLAKNSTVIKTISIPRNSWRELDFHPDMKLLKDVLLSTRG